VIAFMTWQTYTAIRAATFGLEKEINKSGVVLATALANSIQPVWVQDLSHQSELVASLNSFSRSPGASQVLNIVVYDLKNAIGTARGEKQFSRSSGTPIEDPRAFQAEVDIHELAYDGVPVRSFSMALYAAPGTSPMGLERGQPGTASADPSGRKKIGRLEVYISLEQIEESRKELSGAMTKVSATACLVAAAGAFLLAGFLTRPIRALVRDMKHVSQGDLEHKSRVASSDEMGDLARAFNAMTSSLKAAQEAAVEQRALEHELSVATQIQSRLLPSSIPKVEGLDIALYYASAKEVGGDYYDFLRIDQNHLGIVVGDVSGKGIPASLIMTMTRSLLRMAGKGETSPARTVELVNRFLTPDMSPGMFVTLVYFVIDLKSREVRWVRSGHNAPLLYSTRHAKVLHLQSRGMALGLDHEGSLFRSELQVQRFVLQPGDVLVAYTDGIVEGKSREGRDFSGERLAHEVLTHASGSPRALVDAIMQALAQHQRGTEPSDDITLIALKAVGA
jgi:serine phosphatase RsbU (regulator of sigma subunit)